MRTFAFFGLVALGIAQGLAIHVARRAGLRWR